MPEQRAEQRGADGVRRRAGHLVVGLVGLLVIAAGTVLVLNGAPAAAGRADHRWIPPDDTVVGVRGTARGGFTVTHFDGAVWHLPTLSEARAECGAYRKRVREVRCWVAVRTWYRDLGDMKRSLRYVRQEASR